MSAEKRNKFRPKNIPENEIEELDNNAIEDYEPVIEKKKSEGGKNKPKSTPKTTTEKEKPESVKAKKDKVPFMQRVEQFKLFYLNERTQKIVGLILILFSAYLAIAFVSYFLSWQVDQDKVLGSSDDLFSPETKVKNWLGKAGALVSHWFMYKGFGAASFVLVPVFFMYGLQKVVQKKLINIGSFNAKWLFILVWSSLVLSFVFSESLFYMGGGFGYFINSQISNFVGSIGLIALLAFSMLTFLVLIINLSFKLPTKPVIHEDEQIAAELEPEIKNETKDFNSAFNEIKEPKLSAEEEAELLNFEIKGKEEKPNEEVIFQVIAPIKEEAVAEILPESMLEEIEEPIINTAEVIVKNGEPEFEIKEIVEEPIVKEEENRAAKLVEEFGEYDPTLDLGSYQFQSFDLLNDYGNTGTKVNQEELVANKNRILSTLKNYGIEIASITATVGPTVTLYEIVPAAGVRISKIKNLEDDIALSLAALGIRIIAPIPGKGTIGIEVPNLNPEMVPMKNILASEKFHNSQFELPIALGKTISNEIFIADLAKMPHLLMAGATGQGKSVGLNAVLVSLLYKKHPAQVKFVLVDPKKVELTLFNKIERHFLAKLPNSEDAIITDNTKVIHTLNSMCIEMDNRYALLQDAQVRNIKEYNTKFVNRKLNPNDGHKYLPYIVLVVDEFADLIMTAGKEVETPIARLAQLARAIGIHLIIATQRPSVNIITGTIKANFPARIAFRVTSKIDSRTILDSGGADQLIGRGDMLLSTGNDLIRIQCAFVDTPEVEKITEFIGNQRAYPSAFLLPEYVGEDGGDGVGEVDLSERDKMFDEAAKLVVQFQQGSASFLQRKLKLGYNRAGRIVDQLEAAGVIGGFEGSKARDVLVKDMAQLEEILQKLRNR
jgi:S-DNA-T family DNA segregation ATPase FtsK/SpoIIIE